MKLYALLLFLFIILAAQSCANRAPIYRSVYEGLRMREQIVNPADDPSAQPLPRYDEYKEDREQILKPSPPAEE